jgi:Mn-dependent DtxR family transcriptional regulator
MLQSLCQKGLLESAGEMDFRLTEQGAKTIKDIKQAIYSALNSIQPLPVIETMDLASRLKDCADACMVAIEPPGTWCIQHTRKLDPGPGAPVMVRIEQFFTELCAFRDDAHLSAWKSYESNGHAWDILTLLWVEKSKTLEEINSKLKRRGNSLEQSRAAVEQLVKKGWVIQEKDVIRITPFGSEIRKIAEETTDRYYASPFKKFNELDLKKVIELTDKFRRSLPHIE